MKDGEVCIFENFENMELLVGFINIKEQFINNSFIDEAHILISLSEDLLFRKEVLFNKVKNNLIRKKSFSISEFTIKHQNEISAIYEFKNKNHESLSWLEIFQIAIYLKDDKEVDVEITIKNTIKKIADFNRIIQKKY